MAPEKLGAGPGHTLFAALPRPVQLYVWGAVVGCGLLVWSLPPGRMDVMAGLVAVFAAATLLQPIPKTIGGVIVPNLPFILITALLWRPQEALLGAGIGSCVGLLVFRRDELWRAALNGTLIGLPVALAAVVSSCMMSFNFAGGPVAHLIVAAAAALIVYGASHIGLYAGYRAVRFHHVFVPDWLYHFVRNPWSQLISAPLAVVLASVHLRLSGDATGLVFTAACALALPLARQELAYYHQSQEMLDEIVETMIRILDRIMPGARAHSERVSAIAVETGIRLGLPEQALATLKLAARLHDVGLLVGPTMSGPSGVSGEDGEARHRLLDQIPDRVIAAIIHAHRDRWVDREGHRPQARSLVSLGASILAAAELYDSARSGIRPFGRPIPQEAVERELKTLAGSTLDPEVVPIVLRVGYELRSEPIGVPR